MECAWLPAIILLGRAGRQRQSPPPGSIPGCWNSGNPSLWKRGAIRGKKNWSCWNSPKPPPLPQSRRSKPISMVWPSLDILTPIFLITSCLLSPPVRAFLPAHRFPSDGILQKSLARGSARGCQSKRFTFFRTGGCFRRCGPRRNGLRTPKKPEASRSGAPRIFPTPISTEWPT